MKGLEELLEGEGGEEGGLRALVQEEKHSCYGDLREIQVDWLADMCSLPHWFPIHAELHHPSTDPT